MDIISSDPTIDDGGGLSLTLCKLKLMIYEHFTLYFSKTFENTIEVLCIPVGDRERCEIP